MYLERSENHAAVVEVKQDVLGVCGGRLFRHFDQLHLEVLGDDGERGETPETRRRSGQPGRKLVEMRWAMLPGGEQGPAELRVERGQHRRVGLQRRGAGLQDGDGAAQRRHRQHRLLAANLETAF